jgi:hypothetical protein
LQFPHCSVSDTRVTIVLALSSTHKGWPRQEIITVLVNSQNYKPHFRQCKSIGLLFMVSFSHLWAIKESCTVCQQPYQAGSDRAKSVKSCVIALARIILLAWNKLREFLLQSFLFYAIMNYWSFCLCPLSFYDILIFYMTSSSTQLRRDSKNPMFSMTVEK